MSDIHNRNRSQESRTVVSRRVIDAPHERVFAAFRDRDQLERWWGPKGFTNTFHEFDLRPGGTWRFTMHGPDGVDYPIRKQFVEITEPAQIVYQNLDPAHRFQMTMTFVERDGGTELTWAMCFESDSEYEKVHRFVAAANEENFDRLVALLAGATDSADVLTIERVFDAPRPLVFDAWTKPCHLAH